MIIIQMYYPLGTYIMIVLNFHHKHDIMFLMDSTPVLPIKNIINMFTVESKHCIFNYSIGYFIYIEHMKKHY